MTVEHVLSFIKTRSRVPSGGCSIPELSISVITSLSFITELVITDTGNNNNRNNNNHKISFQHPPPIDHWYNWSTDTISSLQVQIGKPSIN